MEHLMDRNPILANAMKARDAAWTTDEKRFVNFAEIPERQWPQIWLNKEDHSIFWSAADVTMIQKWVPGDQKWRTTIEMPWMPEQLLHSIQDRSLKNVINAPGSEEWIVKGFKNISSGGLILNLERI